MLFASKGNIDQGTAGFITHVIYVNIWLAITSFLYLAYNALLTCMLVGSERGRFATHRKTLRVTHPRGIQRSSFFVSMPFKYSIALMLANTVLHFLTSQSLFIIGVITPSDDDRTVTGARYTLNVIGCFGEVLLLCKTLWDHRPYSS